MPRRGDHVLIHLPGHPLDGRVGMITDRTAGKPCGIEGDGPCYWYFVETTSGPGQVIETSLIPESSLSLINEECAA